jgi:hypothetical protein
MNYIIETPNMFSAPHVIGCKLSVWNEKQPLKDKAICQIEAFAGTYDIARKMAYEQLANKMLTLIKYEAV